MPRAAVQRVTADDLGAYAAAGRRIVAITAYTTPEARCCDEAGADLILVGDSLGRAVLGLSDELRVTMEDMLRHTAAAARGVRRALLAADLPFLAYQADPAEAVRNAGRLVQAGASAVKLEGGAERADTVRRIVSAGMPVIGHLGFTPQSVRRFGGARVQGRDDAAATRLLADARALAAAGCCAIVLEMMPAPVAARVSAVAGVPTIGIGAGTGCSGQILVLYDLLGLSARPPRLARTYADVAGTMRQAVAAYAADVRAGTFPGPAETHDGRSWGEAGGEAPG